MTGFITVDKAAGVSSANEVNIIKRLTGTPCGHMGTLDPMATGVLPVAIGNAARLFDYFLSKRKTYIAVFRFGADSDTLDTTGNVIEKAGHIPTYDQIAEVINDFIGGYYQIPPKYSAKNICGKRAYELARAGVEFELPHKWVEIYSIAMIPQENVEYCGFEIECSGGTYIRSIARDLGARLNTCAIMSALRRTKSGVFTIDKAIATNLLTSDNINDYLIKTESVLPFECIIPTESEDKKLFNGLSVDSDLSDGTYKIYRADGSFYGLAEVKSNKLKVRTKLC